MEKRSCNIALVQTSPVEDIETNFQSAERSILDACRSGAVIICLPELFSTPYFPQYIGLDISQYCIGIPGPETERFTQIAQKYEVVLILPFCERAQNGTVYNCAIVIDADGSMLPLYHKIHIPQDPCFYEKGYFCPGDSYKVYKTRYADIAVLICYDQWFPEAARSVALSGAEIIFYPTAIGHIRGEYPADGDWKDTWQLIQRSHAIANSIPVAAVNRCSKEGGLSFFGGSFICDAFGKILGSLEDKPGSIQIELDLSHGPCIRDAWGFFRNRRYDTYGNICSDNAFESGSMNPAHTPANQGFHMPAEWEPHDAVWLSWPQNEYTFLRISEVEKAYLKIIQSLSRSEEVHLLVSDEKRQNQILSSLTVSDTDLSQVFFHQYPYSDVWIRDYGPTFLINRGEKKISAVNWEFNAWGNKYDELLIDGKVPGYMLADLSIKPFVPGIVMEGGSFDVNGRGLVLTTCSCLCNPNRNPSLTRDEIEQYLIDYLGAAKVIWLSDGIVGDDTDGHIDDIARFVSPTTVLCALEDDPDDDNFTALKENYEILCNATDQDENPLTVIPVPMPAYIGDEEQRYPASYLNFYIGNRVVLVPVFNDPHDNLALQIIQEQFPGREVIGIDSRAMVEGYGTIHCATQQQPG